MQMMEGKTSAEPTVVSDREDNEEAFFANGTTLVSLIKTSMPFLSVIYQAARGFIVYTNSSSKINNFWLDKKSTLSGM
jgi:hypothetical protein